MRWLRRWLMLCPERRDQKRRPLEPSEFEINSIRNDKQKLATVRSRCQMHSFTVSRIHCLTNSLSHEFADARNYIYNRVPRWSPTRA